MAAWIQLVEFNEPKPTLPQGVGDLEWYPRVLAA